jgi:hypothetical protein
MVPYSASGRPAKACFRASSRGDRVHDLTNNLVGTPPEKASEEYSPFVDPPRADIPSPMTPVVPDVTVYRAAAGTCLPRLLRIAGPAPWMSEKRHPRGEPTDISTRYRRQLAILAIGLLCEFDDRQRGNPYLHECVRASLVQWQLALRGDGRPVFRRSRRSPMHDAIAALVVQLLTDTACFQTDTLLSDIERHIKWLSKRPAHKPWIEAATISTLADGALLVRDTSLLGRARKRLHALLARQDDEGWFPEEGGADIGNLSLIIDALARLHHQGGWEELTLPLQKALRFLIHFVHPDDSVGGCYGSRGTAFLSPYGVELLAPEFTDAAALALIARRQCERLAADRLAGWHDDMCALMGSRIALATAHGSGELTAPLHYPCQAVGTTEFPYAGLMIFSTKAYHATVSTRKGGSIHVNWRSGKPALEDAGVTAVFPGKVLVSGTASPRTRQNTSGSVVAVSGILRRASGQSDSEPARLFRFRKLRSPAPKEGAEGRRKGIGPDRLTHDRFQREIQFGDDWIRIRDRVLCRLPCRAIVLQAPPPGPINPYADRAATDVPARAPIFVEGGRDVEITRVYRNGELVDRQTGAPVPHVSNSSDAPPAPRRE